MDTKFYTLAGVFSDGGKIQYVLPHFQREYRWKRPSWETLLGDLDALYETVASDPSGKVEHFLGALVTIPDGTHGLSTPLHRLVDGQQRLTTISLLIAAFASLLGDEEAALRDELRTYLLNTGASGDGLFKLLPTLKNGDRAVYTAILRGEPIPSHTSRIPEAFEFFRVELQKKRKTPDFSPELFFRVVLQSLRLVVISLDSGENAYQIFESLNAKAEPLKQSDLVRNYIAMRLSSHKQEEVFQEHWAPIESLLDDSRQVGRIGELTAFLRHVDAMKTGVLPSEKHIYARFRDAVQSAAPTEAQLIEELASLRRYATFYDSFLRPDKGQSSELREALHQLAALDVTTAFPFLLAVAQKADEGVLSLDQYVEACRIIENYLTRRFLAGEASQYLNKMFAALGRALDWDDFLPSLRRALGERRYPSDARIREVLPGADLYKDKSRAVWLLERINRRLYEGTDTLPQLDGKATIEHILPQNPSRHWESDLGEELSAASDLTHTLGNLTLVTSRYNSLLSNDAWSEKRAKLVQHGLRLNSSYFAREVAFWNADTIRERADWLFEQALQIWPAFAEAGGAPTTSSRATPTPPPSALVIRGQRIPVSSWAHLMREVGEFLARDGADFARLSAQFPHLVRREPFERGNYQISSTYYLTTNWNQVMLLNYCSRLLASHGVRADEWSVDS